LKGYSPAFSHLFTFAIYGAVLFTVLSGSHYIYVGTRILNEKR
jgi:hypothetical protein